MLRIAPPPPVAWRLREARGAGALSSLAEGGGGGSRALARETEGAGRNAAGCAKQKARRFHRAFPVFAGQRFTWNEDYCAIAGPLVVAG